MGMGIQTSSAGGVNQSGAAAWQQRQQNLQALAKALQSNNLDAAKSAYASMTANAPASAQSNPNSPLAQLGKALQSGDLAAAQQAFAQMKSGHHHRASIASAPAAPPPGSAPTATSGNNVNVFV
jgi:hypothetical protein